MRKITFVFLEMFIDYTKIKQKSGNFSHVNSGENKFVVHYPCNSTKIKKLLLVKNNLNRCNQSKILKEYLFKLGKGFFN